MEAPPPGSPSPVWLVVPRLLIACSDQLLLQLQRCWVQRCKRPPAALCHLSIWCRCGMDDSTQLGKMTSLLTL